VHLGLFAFRTLMVRVHVVRHQAFPYSFVVLSVGIALLMVVQLWTSVVMVASKCRCISGRNHDQRA
jgi:hypothetical protein